MREEGERGELETYFGDQLAADVQAVFQEFVHYHLHAKAKEVRPSITIAPTRPLPARPAGERD